MVWQMSRVITAFNFNKLAAETPHPKSCFLCSVSIIKVFMSGMTHAETDRQKLM